MKQAESLYSLQGRIALVTGGTRNIGRSISEAFLAHGAKVYINGRNKVALAVAVEQLGDRCTGLAGDISTKAGCDRLLADFSRHEDRLDILVNNAGTATLQTLDQVSEAARER